MTTTSTHISVHAGGTIVIDHQIVGHIHLNEKTGKRTLKHARGVYDLTHVFHTHGLNDKLKEIFRV